jgi:two-component system, NarL family, sensor kinase
MRLQYFLVILFLTVHCAINAQDFSPDGSKKQLEGLSEQQKVHFINKNFYKLYSADFANSKSLTQWAAKISGINKWKEEEAYAYMGWGVITFLSGDYDNVLPKYFKARGIFDSLKNKMGLAAVNNEMAVFYHKQKDLGNALQCLDISESLSRETNNLDHLGTSLGHRGSFLFALGKYSESKPYYLEVLKIRQQTNDSVGLGYVFADLAELVLNENNFDQAMVYLDMSTAIREKTGDLQGVAVNSVNRGENYFKAKQYQQSAFWFEKGLKQSLAIGFDDLSRHTYDYLGKTYQALGDYKKAYALQEKSIAFKDSLFNADRTRVIQEMQTKYETEKKELQITQLNQDNELKSATIQRNYFLFGGLAAVLFLAFLFWRYRDQQKQKAIMHEQKLRLREAQINAVIDSQEKERKRFASDLHDGMGQLISTLQLNIQSIKESKDLEKTIAKVENSEQLLSEIQMEIRNIAFNLMPPVLVKEGLVPAVRELVRRLNKTGLLKITLVIHKTPDRFSSVIEISIYRIIQELLSNIVKHSGANEVTISFTGFETEITLTIEDNGNGYDLKTFQHSDRGNGWTTIQARMNLIHSQIEFDTQVGRKNNFVTINFPTPLLESTSLDEVKNT